MFSRKFDLSEFSLSRCLLRKLGMIFYSFSDNRSVSAVPAKFLLFPRSALLPCSRNLFAKLSQIDRGLLLRPSFLHSKTINAAVICSDYESSIGNGRRTLDRLADFVAPNFLAVGE